MDLPIAVSFGGGVQSTAILHLVLDGKLPRPDVWVFADTGDEPRDVYAHVEACKGLIAAAGMDFQTVRHKSGMSLRHWTLNRLQHTPAGVDVPMFVEDKKGGAVPVRRSCTVDFKLKPIWDYLKERYGPVKRGGKPVAEVWVGISLDETQRMKDSPKKWLHYSYPLIDTDKHPARRAALLRYLAGKGVDAPRSACYFCPFHSNDEWKRVRKMGLEWDNAQHFEAEVQRLWPSQERAMQQFPYLHRSRVPLADVDLNDAQMEMFGGMDNECDGVCGV